MFTAVAKMKGDSADELNRIHRAVTTAVNAQESVGRPIVSHGMDLFNHLVVELFDPRTRLEWEASTCDSREPPDHETLLNFMSKRILTLNAARPKGATKVNSDSSRSAKSHFTKHSSDSPRCALCKENHSLLCCSEFKAKSASDRKSFVEATKLCFNCLGNHQVAKCQSTKNCFTCQARHHTMLHDAYTPQKSAEVSALSVINRTRDTKATLLATARVIVADRFGDPQIVRALIDQGSEVSIVSESLVQRLRLQRTRSDVSIVGIGGTHSGSTRGKVTLHITSRKSGAKFNAVTYVLPRLSLYEGPSTEHRNTWPHIQGLPLADPQFFNTDPIELLLGAEICSTILDDGLRKGGPQMPIAQNTKLGWILSGGCGTTSLHGVHRSLQCTTDNDLIELLRRFWEQEREPNAPAVLTPEKEQCEDIFIRTHERTTEGRYVVRLPFATTPTTLAETRKPAERLLSAMERRCAQDPRFGEMYRSFMRDYEDLGHMEVASAPSPDNANMCFLPHHGVVKESSTTTKLRVVFNGSQRSRSGESLNTHFLSGANLLPALADVILRWRWHRYAIISDIEKMYRQISVHPDDRDFQTILWRHNITDDVRAYRLTTVTYGLACAPFLAIRTLRQLADDEKSRYPRGASVLQRDCYVDDIVTGANSLSDAIAVKNQLRDLCTAGGFPLRKWAANHEAILDGIPQEHRLHTTAHSWQAESHSTLGLRWHPADDTFSLIVHPRPHENFTKRQVLAETARLFDPLGWLAPKLDWDTPLPVSDTQLWRQFIAELPLLEQLRIPRWIGTDTEYSRIEIHGFSDASERGYAAVVYLRTSLHNSIAVHLLIAKSRVAPVKQVSLPRLELCAAALLTTLTHHVKTELHLATAPVHLWSDSKVTLHWIQGHTSRWKTYVANRVSHIQQQLPDAQWHHVPGRDNPADAATRGIVPSELLNHPLWWSGPAWLRENESEWPNESVDTSDGEMPEARRTVINAAQKVDTEPAMLRQFSTLQRLLRVTAWCRRWQRTALRRQSNHVDDSGMKSGSVLQPTELDDALHGWLRVVQALHYPAEVAAITAHRTIPHRSPLASLNPFLDNNGVLRVGGRLKHALLSHDERHPMIAPTTSWLTQLLVSSCHLRSLHGGAQLTLGLLRLRFWVPQGRNAVRHVLRRCTTCARWRANTPQPPMGNLPQNRITPARPFLRTGVDYAGPILVRTSKGRGNKAHKAFIAVFICLCSRAVHLEVVSDYTTEAFLAAYRRFVSRRGLCEDVFSDCGTNFVGADRALRELLSASSSDGRRIARTAAANGTKWHFNPPAAPHFGGLWEAAIKSTKHHLRRVIGETTLTYEEMSTFLAQVEACLNSRPLQALSDDPDDIAALTPGHFLIGAPLLAVPEPSLDQRADNTLSRWQHVQKMRDHFWQRWSREYIHSLVHRRKWTTPDKSPEIGRLCLIRSELTPPSRWPLARIIKLHPGDDGIVRVVTVRTATSELVRPLIKLVLLPNASETSSSPAHA